MPIDPDQQDLVREALEGADSVDARGITVDAAADAVVLRGSVATHEEATAAAAIAEQHADAVRSELSIDHNLRERTDMAEEAPTAAPRDTQGSTFDPVNQPDDLVSDMQESLEENVPWDPPHEAVQVPTRAEERGHAGRGATPQPGAADDLLDEAADPAAKSLPDLSPEELSQAAHPQPRDEENA